MATEVVRVEASGGRPGWTAGRRRAVVGLALTGWLLFVGIATVTLVVEAANHRADFSDLANAIGFLAFASMGALLATRLPTNAVGWTLLVVALAAILNRAISAYLAAAVQSDLPAEALIAWVDSWMWAVSLGTAMIVLPVVFPDGRVPRGRLRALIWAMVAVFVVAPVFVALAPGPFAGLPSVDNPIGLAVLQPVTATGREILPSLGIVPIITCALIPLVRYRRAEAVERAQIRWFACAAALLAVLLLANASTDDALQIPLAIAIGLVPAAIGVAILRYHLYDIDVLISRTLVWVPLTALLGGGYAALVALLQRVFVNLTGDRSDAAVIISTLVLASLFTPVRRVLDSIVDARFRSSRAAAPVAAMPGGHVGHPVGSAGAAAVGHSPVDLAAPALTRQIELVATRVVREALAADRARQRDADRRRDVAPED
jgi:hypothetical protein